MRPQDSSERKFVLKTWKNALEGIRKQAFWGKGLLHQDFWTLADFVIDHITYPTVTVFIAHHKDEPETALGWVAIRPSPPPKPTTQIVFSYVKAKFLDMGLHDQMRALLPFPQDQLIRVRFNLFEEITKHRKELEKCVSFGK